MVLNLQCPKCGGTKNLVPLDIFDNNKQRYRCLWCDWEGQPKLLFGDGGTVGKAMYDKKSHWYRASVNSLIRQCDYFRATGILEIVDSTPTCKRCLSLLNKTAARAFESARW